MNLPNIHKVRASLHDLSALLADAEPFDPAVIPLAQRCARSRVVLKRRLKDPVALKPDWTLKGRSVRYDVYQGHLGHR